METVIEDSVTASRTELRKKTIEEKDFVRPYHRVTGREGKKSMDFSKQDREVLGKNRNWKAKKMAKKRIAFIKGKCIAKGEERKR